MPTGTRRIMLWGDTHIPFEDVSILNVIKEFQQDFKPHVVVHTGDLMSLEQFSKFANNYKNQTFDDWTRGNQILDEMRITHITLGNHDWRHEKPDYIPEQLRKDNNPVIRLNLQKRGIHWKPYDNKKGIFKFGKLSVLHGYCCPKGASEAHAKTYGCCAFGHTHRMQIDTPGHAFYKDTGFNIGCTCRLDLEYTKWGMPNGWVNAFAYGYIYKNGQFNLNVYRLVGNQFVINDKTYTRKCA